VIGHDRPRRQAPCRRAQATASGQFPAAQPGWLRRGRWPPTRAISSAARTDDGQILCSAAGYDPRGLARFLASLMTYEKLGTGQIRRASYFDTHPLSSERATVARVEASELRWKRDPS
jgi:predicted Zn-dependent protease